MVLRKNICRALFQECSLYVDTAKALVPEQRPIYVTRPSLPKLEEFLPLLQEIWDSRILTNAGAIHQRFEAELCAYLGVEHLCLVANATLGAEVAMRHLGISGEVVTTPFSFVATSNSIVMAGAEPVFADIDPQTLNLDPEAVARAITPRTRAIVPVHCYGVPCDTDALRDIADRHGLPLVYDAAHAFGVTRDGQSLLAHGDLSIVSFHATKVFSSVEGGAIICKDRETKLALDRLINHGIDSETSVPVVGTNAKMSELHAAFGLLQLAGLTEAIAARARVAQRYHAALAGVPGLHCLCPPDLPGHNHYAFPVLVGPEYGETRDALYLRLARGQIFARRYFYPLISDLPAFRGLASAARDGLPVAARAAEQVLCLPLFPELSAEDQDRVIAALVRP